MGFGPIIIIILKNEGLLGVLLHLVELHNHRFVHFLFHLEAFIIVRVLQLTEVACFLVEHQMVATPILPSAFVQENSFPFVLLLESFQVLLEN